MKDGKVLSEINARIKEKEKIHMTLFDPDPKKMKPERAAEIAALAEEAGTSAFMVGGSTGIGSKETDEIVSAIKGVTPLPVILFPSASVALSGRADAIFFISLLNSRNIKYVIGEQVKGVEFVKRSGVEPIGVGYIIVEPGMTVGRVGEANLIPRNRPDLAVRYGLAAQYLGMELLYFEAGSGADSPVPIKVIRMVKEKVDIPIIVGGGIRNSRQAREIAKAGADIIVTGTIIEEEGNTFKTLSSIIRAFKN